MKLEGITIMNRKERKKLIISAIIFFLIMIFALIGESLIDYLLELWLIK